MRTSTHSDRSPSKSTVVGVADNSNRGSPQNFFSHTNTADVTEYVIVFQKADLAAISDQLHFGLNSAVDVATSPSGVQRGRG